MPLHPLHRRALLRGRTNDQAARGGPATPWPGSAGVGTSSRPATGPGVAVAASRSEATLARPTARMLRAGFRQIAHAAALGGDANASLAWYCLRREIVKTQDQQFALTGYMADLRSPRTADAGAAKQWASAGGFDAFLVIGRNLRFLTPDAWTKADGPGLPFVTGALTGRPVLPAGGQAEGTILSALTFPSGGFADTSPGKDIIVREFGLEAFRFVVGDSLDLALVVQASRVNTGVTTNYVDGFADIEMKVADVYRSREFA